ncbi:MAG: hypothetical protein PHP05_03995 [Sideroxydans sp.]|nr:hypothetical protein [Sideroxydans sp.]
MMPSVHLPTSDCKHQHGGALLVMLVILVMGITTAIITSLSSTAINNKRHESSADALAQAKDALMGYAITYGDTHPGKVHGYLPCPDPNGTGYGANDEGSSDTCGNQDVSVMGRLPWKTLGLPELRDGNGECLWYAVSGIHKNNPMTGEMMNEDTSGLLEILDSSGATIASNVVAIVFAPGAALDNQNRSPDGTAPICGGNYNPANYLDNDGTINNASISGSAGATSQFRLASSALMNDQIIYITREEIFNARNIRAKLDTLTHKAAECIANYGKRNNGGLSEKNLPWAGRLYSPSNDYWTDSNYDDASDRMAGRLPNRVNTSDSDNGNQIDSPYYQLTSDGHNCPNVADWPDYYPWWTNWKDHLFYALAYRFRPSSGWTYCGTCLEVNYSGNYAAVVMFSGPPLAGQTRATTSDRLDFSNYLEGRNYTYTTGSNPNSSGDKNYQSGNATSTFNDVLYCINPDLSVSPC